MSEYNRESCITKPIYQELKVTGSTVYNAHDMQKTIDNLISDLALAKEGLEFYSERVWREYVSESMQRTNRCVDHGKKAREILAQLDKKGE